MGDITVKQTVSPAMLKRLGWLSTQRGKAQELRDKLAAALAKQG